MRVVHCVRSSGFAGVERYLTYVAPELRRRGWDVVVVGGDSKRMRDELGEVTFLAARTTTEVASRLKSLPGDIIHAHMTAAEIAAVMNGYWHRRPVVCTRHFAAVRGSSLPAKLAGRVIARRLAAQISISRFVAGAIGEPSVVILNGVPLFQGARSPEHVVLVAQRLDAEKRTRLAIDAWARTQLGRTGWSLLIAGDGAERLALEDLASRRGLSDSISFLGNRSDVPSLMKRASVLLAPAPAEPFGFSVAEAMAQGLPVLAAGAGAHLETVGAVDPRWLFEPDNPAAAAHVLEEACADEMQLLRYGESLRTWQRERLSLAGHVDQLEAIYGEVLH